MSYTIHTFMVCVKMFLKKQQNNRNSCYYSRLLSREVFLCACTWKSRGSQRDMGQCSISVHREACYCCLPLSREVLPCNCKAIPRQPRAPRCIIQRQGTWSSVIKPSLQVSKFRYNHHRGSHTAVYTSQYCSSLQACMLCRTASTRSISLYSHPAKLSAMHHNKEI